MELTTSLVAGYIHGQMEMKKGDGTAIRGEIQSAIIHDDSLLIRLAWAGKKEASSSSPDQWIGSLDLDHSINLGFYRAKDIGPGVSGGNRIALNSPGSPDMYVLYPPDGDKLYRSLVGRTPPAPQK